MPQEFAPGLFVQINRVQVGYLFHFTVYRYVIYLWMGSFWCKDQILNWFEAAKDIKPAHQNTGFERS